MSNPINVLSITKEALAKGVDQALADYKVAALTKKSDQALYDYIAHSQDILWQCVPTILSPKKFFFPTDEVILDYTEEGKVSPRIAAQPLVLFGIRPCDLNGINILDEAFAEGHGDPNYLAKREQAIIIGMDCKGVCDEDAFCYKVNAHKVSSGFDAMIYPMGDHFTIAVATQKGADFFKKYFDAQDGNQQEIEQFKQEKEKQFTDRKPFENLHQFPEIFEKNKDHQVWEEEGSRCLSCGSCIMVCPTCYCFDVADELALSLKKGERIRRWDACVLSPFAEVAGGESFRKLTKNRLHHRIDRKFNFLMKKHGQSACVGCGRCVRACLAEISPKKIAEKIVGEE